MADDFDKKMDQVKNLLSNDKMVDNLKMLMGVLENSMKKNTDESSAPQRTEPIDIREPDDPPQMQSPEIPPATAPASNFAADISRMETVMKIKTVIDRITNPNDQDVNFLTALKPYLSSKRQEKIDTAIKLVGISKLPSVIRELEQEQSGVRNETGNL